MPVALPKQPPESSGPPALPRRVACKRAPSTNNDDDGDDDDGDNDDDYGYADEADDDGMLQDDVCNRVQRPRTSHGTQIEE